MATVFQLIARPGYYKNLETGILDDYWHVAINADCWRTACGVQLEGDDWIISGPEKEGRVTCPKCRAIIEQYQSIKNWR